jgi:5-methylthioadenosine/S-adenosylhomocysteine deaminase
MATAAPPPIYLIELLVINGCVVTMDVQATVIESGAVAIDLGRIVWVGPSSDAGAIPAQEVLDVHGAIVVPGLVDTHFHTGQQLLRGKIAELAGRRHLKMPIWRNYLIPFESVLTEDDMYLSARFAYANLLRSGTTCFSEAGGPHPDLMGRAALEVGIRGNVAVSTVDTGDGFPALARTTTAQAIDRNVALVKRWEDEGEGRVTGWLSLRQITVCSEELWRTLAEAAVDLDCRIHTHLAEGTYEVDYTTERYGSRPAEWLESIGILSGRLHAAHSILLSDDEVDLIGRRDVSVAHCPNGNFRIGPAKIPALRRAGVRVGLGSDGASSGAIDILEASRMSRVGLQTAFATPWHVFSELSDFDYLRMATRGGAEALGLGGVTGSIEAGQQADMIVVEHDSLEALPALDPVFVLARCASGRDVRSVVVAGRVVVRDRRITTLDEDALAAEVQERSAQIMARFEATL